MKNAFQGRENIVAFQDACRRLKLPFVLSVGDIKDKRVDAVISCLLGVAKLAAELASVALASLASQTSTNDHSRALTNCASNCRSHPNTTTATRRGAQEGFDVPDSIMEKLAVGGGGSEDRGGKRVEASNTNPETNSNSGHQQLSTEVFDWEQKSDRCVDDTNITVFETEL